jgi:hypothetical protein
VTVEASGPPGLTEEDVEVLRVATEIATADQQMFGRPAFQRANLKVREEEYEFSSTTKLNNYDCAYIQALYDRGYSPSAIADYYGLGINQVRRHAIRTCSCKLRQRHRDAVP